MRLPANRVKRREKKHAFRKASSRNLAKRRRRGRFREEEELLSTAEKRGKKEVPRFERGKRCERRNFGDPLPASHSEEVKDSKPCAPSH